MADNLSTKGRAFYFAMLDASLAHNVGEIAECKKHLAIAGILAENVEERLNRLADFCKQHGY